MWHMLRSGFAAIALLLFPPSAAGKPRSGRRTRRTGFPERVRKRHVAHLARCSHAAFPVSGRNAARPSTRRCPKASRTGKLRTPYAKQLKAPKVSAHGRETSSIPARRNVCSPKASARAESVPRFRGGERRFRRARIGERDRDGAPYNIVNQYEKRTPQRNLPPIS